MQLTGWKDTGWGAPAVLFARDTTDASGAFRLEGLAAGTWKVAAQEPGRESDPKTIPLHKDATVEGVRLVVHRSFEVRGNLHFDDGTPVADAGLLAFVTTPGAVPMATSGKTDAGGRFTLHLRGHGGDPLLLEICQPGSWTGATRATVGPELDLTLPRPAGGLVIHLPAGMPKATVALVRNDGTPVFVTLMRVSGCGTSSAGTIRLPALETGTWKLVRPTSGPGIQAILSGAGFALPGPVATVTPGATTTVTLDADK